jgi:hypothetical protein
MSAPPGGAGIAALVGRLRRVLGNTPPFGQIPVELPHTAHRVTSTRSATVSLAVKLRDPVTGFSDAILGARIR